MTCLHVSPDGQPRSQGGALVPCLSFQEAIDRAGPGDTIELLPGLYREPVTISGKHCPAGSEILIHSDGGATMDGGRNVLRPPGQPTGEDYAFIKVIRCCGIVIANATIQNVWPTAIYIEESSRIVVRKMNLNGATYGIYARGGETRDLLIERCSWIQDERIWDKVLWKDIHDPPMPRRELDGDFFRSSNIFGDVVIRYNYIAHAFNGIHLFAPKRCTPGAYNNNVWIYRNTFAFIRDSAVEAEHSATNWWVFENVIYNCHTWFAFEWCNGGFCYVFSNRGWFDRVPGPPGDCNTGGGVFKSAAVKDKAQDETDFLPKDPVYVFHNSFYLRSSYIKKGKLRHFDHFNNAIDYARPQHHLPGTVDRSRKMIGVGPPGDARCEDLADPPVPFTRDWRHFDIRFENDVCNHPSYPAGLNADAYPVRGIAADPGFEAARDGNFALRADSPCVKAGISRQLKLEAGGVWTLPSGGNIGAMDGAKKALPQSPKALGCPAAALPICYVDDPSAEPWKVLDG